MTNNPDIYSTMGLKVPNAKRKRYVSKKEKREIGFLFVGTALGLGLGILGNLFVSAWLKWLDLKTFPLKEDVNFWASMGILSGLISLILIIGLWRYGTKLIEGKI